MNEKRMLLELLASQTGKRKERALVAAKRTDILSVDFDARKATFTSDGATYEFQRLDTKE